MARPSEKAMGKDAGVKSPQSYLYGTSRTFCPEGAADGLCSRPQQNMPFEIDSKASHIAFRTALLAALAAIAGTGYMLFEAQWLRLVLRQLEIPGLPAELEGLSMLHASDLHAGAPGLNSRVIGKFVESARSLSPDVVFLTGDLTDKKKDLSPFIESLVSLEARYGKFACLGNHDHGLRKTVIEDLARRLTGRSPIRKSLKEKKTATVSSMRKLLAQAGVRVLENECATVRIGGHKIQFCGIDDFNYGYADLVSVASQLESGAGLRILLSHSPDVIGEIEPGNFQLVLAGHTHGGQICMPNPHSGKIMLSTSGSRYGEGQFQVDGTVMHVSRGVGTTLVPFRLLSRPEITMIKLKRKTA